MEHINKTDQRFEANPSLNPEAIRAQINAILQRIDLSAITEAQSNTIERIDLALTDPALSPAGLYSLLEDAQDLPRTLKPTIH